mmetsp:Transcript_3635/g.6563  ORF Transcript_3635/g.6563 Transcript_3635/m.6563 type:complete len:205 (-) Transcript_3635:283-897(-)
MVLIQCFGSIESEWFAKTVDEFKFYSSTRHRMNGFARSDGIVHPEDGIEGSTLVMGKAKYHLNPGDAILIRVNLFRHDERLVSLRQIKSGVGVSTDPIRSETLFGSWLNACTINITSSIPSCTFVTTHIVLSHHALIFVKEQMAMLKHVPCKLIYLEPHFYSGLPRKSIVCTYYLKGRQLQCILPISHLVPTFYSFCSIRIGVY